MKVTDLLSGTGASAEDLKFAELIFNQLRRELGYFGLPSAIARIIPLLKRAEPQRERFSNEQDYNFALLLHKYQPLKIMHELIAQVHKKEHANLSVGDLLVEVSVEFAHLHYPQVLTVNEFDIFAAAVFDEKKRDPFMTANITINPGCSVDFTVTRCLYVEVLRQIGLGEIAHRICDPYIAYCDKYQPLLEGYLAAAIGNGATSCSYGYRLKMA